jgi:hypothetical protein
MDSWILELLIGNTTTTAPPPPAATTAGTVARQQEVARPKPLYLNQMCILNERDLHLQVVAETRRQYPHALLVGGICEQAEGAAGRALAVQLGYTAGQPDLLILNRGSRCSGLAVEFKHPGFSLEDNEPRKTQLEYHEQLRSYGWRVVVCNSAFEAMRQVDDYMRTQVQRCCECCNAWWDGEKELQAHLQRKVATKRRLVPTPRNQPPAP